MTLSKELLDNSKMRLPLVSFLIGLIGTTLSMWGASWDVTSHLLRTPETFFTPSHGILYLGVGISLIGAILGLILFFLKKELRSKSFTFGYKLLAIGAVMQIIAGPGDFLWHEQFGIDGLLSPTHITLALGVMTVLIGSIIGMARIQFHLNKRSSFLSMLLPVSFGIFWFSVMWLLFFFVLPISSGDTFNFNPDPYVAIVLSFVFIPIAFSMVFWTTSKTLNHFGAASVAALSFMMMNITSNILTSESLLFYLPWFIAPIAAAVASDYIFHKKGNSKLSQKHSEKISGAILGSMFFMFCFPMLAMTFLDVYLYNDVFAYDILPTASETVFDIWLMTIPLGALSGTVGMIISPKLLKFYS